VFFISCGNDEVIEFINTHPRPIIVISKSYDWLNNVKYVFRDSSGVVYQSPLTNGLFLPDTIR